VWFDYELLRFFSDDLRVGTEVFTLPARVDGTTQFTYYSARVDVLVSDGATIQAFSPLGSNIQPIDPSTRVYINQNYYDLADGALGLGQGSQSAIAAFYGRVGPSGTPRSGFMQLIDSDEPIFGLDFSSNARMTLGGVDEAYRARVAWSLPKPNWVDEILPSYHSFPLYAPRMCGTDLLGNISTKVPLGPDGGWHAFVDTASSCLTLPAEMHALVISWLPVSCTLGNYDRLARICYLTDDVRASLPSLSFRLSSALDAQELVVDLTRLLFVPRGVPMNRFCLIRAESMLGGPTPNNAIVLGGRLLQQLYVVFDLRGGSSRVGLAQIDPLAKESRVQCAPRVQCAGMQEHYPALNTCLPPACADYYFFDVDPEDPSMCRLSSAFHILVGVLVGAFALLELGLNEWVMRLAKRVSAVGVVYGQ